MRLVKAVSSEALFSKTLCKCSLWDQMRACVFLLQVLRK